MYSWILLVVLQTGPYTILFEKYEDCASSGTGLIDAYHPAEIKAVCMRTIAI